MALIKVDAFQCDKCNHIWISDRYTHKNPPNACSKCKSSSWDLVRKQKLASKK